MWPNNSVIWPYLRQLLLGVAAAFFIEGGEGRNSPIYGIQDRVYYGIMNNAHSDIEEFLKDFWDKDICLSTGSDIFKQLGISGDDGFEFIEQFSNKHEINMTNYRWFFHHDEEGFNIGGFLFKPPNKRVDRIPITPELLAEAIYTKQWPLQYPQHELPKTRLDLRFNQLIMAVSVTFLVASIFQRYT